MLHHQQFSAVQKYTEVPKKSMLRERRWEKGPSWNGKPCGRKNPPGNRNPRWSSGVFIAFIATLIGLTHPFLSSPVQAQPVTTVVMGTESLGEAWKQTIEKHPGTSSFWMVYSIEKEMCAHCFWGMWGNSEDAGSKKPRRIDEIVLGIPAQTTSLDERVRSAIALIDDDGSKQLQEMVIKQVALLFHIEKGRVSRVAMGTIDSRFDFESEPIYWFGVQKEDESQRHLIQLFESLTTVKSKQSVIWAIGMHPSNPPLIQFLQQIVTDNSDKELSKSALFALGSTDAAESLSFLSKFIRSESSTELKRSAIYAVGNSSHPNARSILLDFIAWENSN